jgi:hypothetical protein
MRLADPLFELIQVLVFILDRHHSLRLIEAAYLKEHHHQVVHLILLDASV